METNTSNPKVIEANNTLAYVLGSLLVILTGYMTYIYTSHDILKKGQLSEKYILKNNLDFTMLSSYEKSRYVELYKHNNELENLKQEIQSLRDNNVQNNSLKIVEKIVEVEKVVKVPVEKIVEVEKIVPVDKTSNVPMNIQDEVKIIKEIKKSNLTFNTYTCKSMDAGGINISKKCRNELYKFLEENKTSKVFEVIGMVDDKDFKFINRLKDVYGEKKIKHLSKYSQIGLSRQRVIEASWVIKKHLGDYKYIKTVNYTVNSKDKKGFIVRAYK